MIKEHATIKCGKTNIIECAKLLINKNIMLFSEFCDDCGQLLKNSNFL